MKSNNIFDVLAYIDNIFAYEITFKLVCNRDYLSFHLVLRDYLFFHLEKETIQGFQFHQALHLQGLLALQLKIVALTFSFHFDSLD